MIRELLMEIRKDFRLFTREPRTVILVTAAPLLIMIILASIFSSEATTIKGIRVAVCKFDNNISFDMPVFEEVFFSGSNCEEITKDYVSTGKFKAAVIIPKNFENDLNEGKGALIKSYIDNSKGQIAVVSSNAIAAYVQQANEKIGVQFIEQAWENLKKLDVQLEEVQRKLVLGATYSADAQDKLNSALEIAQGIETPIEDVKILNDQLSNISGQIADLNLSENNAELLSNLSESMAAMPSTAEIIQNLSGQISSLCPNSTECDKINGILQNLIEVSGNFDSNAKIVSQQINLLTNLSDIYNQKVNETNSRLNELQSNITQTKEKLNTLQEKLKNLSESKQIYVAKLISLNETLANLSSDLNSLNLQLNDTRNILAQYTSKEPQSVIRPITINETKVFPGERYIYFISPALICVILIFIITLSASSNIVQERKSGTMVRNVLSPAPIVLFMVEKLIYFVILSFVQVAIMLLVLFAFGVSFPITSAAFVVILLASVVFTTIGLVIGNISKSENTALLTSLVLSIPMLFLSGTFFSFEIMPDFMQSVGKVLPLTVVIQSLERIIIYKTPVLTEDIIYLAVVSAILFVISVLLIKKEGILK